MKRPARRGSTLVELTIGLGMAALLSAAVFLAAGRVGGAMTQNTEVANLQSRTSGGLQSVEAVLRGAAVGTLTLSPGDGGSAIDFRTALGYEAGEVVYSEIQRLILVPSLSDPINGADDDGDGLVDEHRLVLLDLSISVDPIDGEVVLEGVDRHLEGEIPFNDVDDNHNGLTDESGFWVTRDSENRLTVRMSATSRVSDGQYLSRTETITIRLQN